MRRSCFLSRKRERVRLGGPPQLRSIICSRVANARTGIAPTPRKSGTGTPARRSGSNIAPETEARERVTLGSDLSGGERPQAVVPAHAWQAAETLGEWTLVGCTVAPGFDFAQFELAPKGWEPE